MSEAPVDETLPPVPQQKITVGYWSIRGLAAPLRMMVMYRNIPLEANNYDCVEKEGGGFDVSSWFNVKDQYKSRNALMNLQYVEDGDMLVTQSNACVQYLGRRLKMMGSTERDMVDVEQLLCEYMDVRNAVIRFVYGSDVPAVTNIERLLSKGSNIDKLHSWLQRKYENQTIDGPLFFVGNDVTAADFTIWEILDQIKSMAVFFQMDHDAFSNYPLIAAFHAGFRDLPNNQRYFNSPLAALPANNLSAKVYGATPSGAPYVAGSERPWQNSTGMY